ncbi:MAG: amidase family protein [Vicinamibacterales bacterium]
MRPGIRIDRRRVLGLALMVMSGAGCRQALAPAGPAGEAAFTVVEAGIPEVRAALDSGRITSRQLVTQYLARIGTYEDRINAIITVNPGALEEADRLDRERAAGRVRGPLHGIPIALKDNIHTTDIRTTGGALAFATLMPPYDATLTTNLREAGAIIIAKTVLTELAHWTAGPPTPMVANYTAVAGFAYNPYDPRMDPRPETLDGRPVLSTGGSSSGAGTAASFWAASVGSDTGGSIISPSNATMLVGIRPTLGRISRYGIIPITADHDTAGPMARTVADAAILMGALESASPDPNDAATTACEPPPNRDYTAFLDGGALKGARIGIPRAFYYDRVKAPGDEARPEFKNGRGGLNADQAKVMAEAIALLKAQGAEVVDPVEIPSIVSQDPASNFLLFDYCQGAEHGKGGDAHCTANFKYGMKRDFNAWLASLGDRAPVKSLTELREWNLAHAKMNAMRFGQSRLDISDEMDVVRDRARNEADTAKDRRLSRDEGLDAVLRAHELDAILTPGSSGANMAARANYPIITVPFGMVPNAPTPPLPAGFNAKPAPFGVAFTGAACSEPRLIALAYAFEQASRRRVPPLDMP